MIIKVSCEDCGKTIGEIDTSKDKGMKAFRAPCGSRVCESCCRTCRKESEQRGDPCRMGIKHDAV